MGNHTLRSLSLSYQQKIGGQGPTNLSLGATPTIKLYSAVFTDFIPEPVSYKRGICGTAHQSFFWYYIDNDLMHDFP